MPEKLKVLIDLDTYNELKTFKESMKKNESVIRVYHHGGPYRHSWGEITEITSNDNMVKSLTATIQGLHDELDIIKNPRVETKKFTIEEISKMSLMNFIKLKFGK